MWKKMSEFSFVALVIFFWITAIIVCASCAPSKPFLIRDVEQCTDLGDHGAACAHSNEPVYHDVYPDEWEGMRVGRTTCTAHDFNTLMQELKELCAERSSGCEFIGE